MPYKKMLEQLEEWRVLNHAQEEADDHQLCPECNEQLAFCECPNFLAAKLLRENYGSLKHLLEENTEGLKKYRISGSIPISFYVGAHDRHDAFGKAEVYISQSNKQEIIQMIDGEMEIHDAEED